MHVEKCLKTLVIKMFLKVLLAYCIENSVTSVSQWSYTLLVIHAEKYRRELVIKMFLRMIKKSMLVIVFEAAYCYLQ